MVICDFNIRLQQICYTLTKINNSETPNVPDINLIRAGLLTVVKHKNGIIHFIDQIFKPT